MKPGIKKSAGTFLVTAMLCAFSFTLKAQSYCINKEIKKKIRVIQQPVALYNSTRESKSKNGTPAKSNPENTTFNNQSFDKTNLNTASVTNNSFTPNNLQCQNNEVIPGTMLNLLAFTPEEPGGDPLEGNLDK